MTKRSIPGIHHVTAIAGDPQRNLDFYTGVLGLRLVKLTINFDDPGTYHFYFGNETGRPGTILTFFPWPGAQQGRSGSGQTAGVSFAIPLGSLSFWRERLTAHKVSYEGAITRFDEQVLAFSDPDQLPLELIATERGAEPRSGGPVPLEHGIRGFHSVTLAEKRLEPTAALLTDVMGFRQVAEAGNRFRYAAGDGGAGALVDVLHEPDLARGVVAVGSVHHVAWRTPDEAEQREWRGEIDARGYHVTPVIDRTYFHSIYFREPGGVLFEIATDPPGFTVDEAAGELGRKLQLPVWLEGERGRIERALPKIQVISR